MIQVIILAALVATSAAADEKNMPVQPHANGPTAVTSIDSQPSPSVAATSKMARKAAAVAQSIDTSLNNDEVQLAPPARKMARKVMAIDGYGNSQPVEHNVFKVEAASDDQRVPKMARKANAMKNTGVVEADSAQP